MVLGVYRTGDCFINGPGCIYIEQGIVSSMVLGVYIEQGIVSSMILGVYIEQGIV